MNLAVLMNLIYFYVAILELTGTGVTRAMSLLYKCAYYHSRRSTPLMFAVLMTFPDVMPKLAPEYDVTKCLMLRDPLISTMQTVLANTNYFIASSTVYDREDANLNKKSMLFLVQRYYQYQSQKPTFVEMVTECIRKLQTNAVTNVAHSLILIAKRLGTDWAQQNIVKLHLLPLLDEYMKNVLKSTEHDDQLVTILYTVSCIVKTLPVTENIDAYLQRYVTVLEATERAVLQEAAVAALLQSSRFGYANVYQKIVKWNPAFRISRRLQCMLQTFVYRKERSFWE